MYRCEIFTARPLETKNRYYVNDTGGLEMTKQEKAVAYFKIPFRNWSVIIKRKSILMQGLSIRRSILYCRAGSISHVIT